MDKRTDRQRKIQTFVSAILVLIVLIAVLHGGTGDTGDQSASEVATTQEQAALDTGSESTEAADSTESTGDVDASASVSASALDPVVQEDSRTVQIGDCSVFLTATPDPEGVTISLDAAYGDLDSAQLSGTTISVAKNETGTLSFAAPMEATSEMAAVTVTLSDAGEESKVLLSPELYYTDEQLEDLYWNAGTFDAVSDSVNYHYRKHHEEIDADNLQGYLTDAMDCRTDVLENPEDFTDHVSTGEIPAHTYRDADGRFIILTDEGDEILSFGGPDNE